MLNIHQALNVVSMGDRIVKDGKKYEVIHKETDLDNKTVTVIIREVGNYKSIPGSVVSPLDEETRVKLSEALSAAKELEYSELPPLEESIKKFQEVLNPLLKVTVEPVDENEEGDE